MASRPPSRAITWRRSSGTAGPRRDGCASSARSASRCSARPSPRPTSMSSRPAICWCAFCEGAGRDEARIGYTLVPTLVRGLDYYTRTAFEFVSPSLGPSQATVLGGGRYDGLAEALGGPATPGVGFGSGLERLLLALGGEWDP